MKTSRDFQSESSVIRRWLCYVDLSVRLSTYYFVASVIKSATEYQRSLETFSTEKMETRTREQ